MSCTAPKLTQHTEKSNNFLIPSGKLATRGFFEEKIKFEQWHIFRELKKHTRNINVINLASLLAVLPRMGIYAYEITQAELAEKMARMFEMPTVPSRRTISAWENQLASMGYIGIPKHVDWRNSKTKIRVLTEKFWTLSRAGLPNLSYTCPHGTFCTGKVEKVEHYIPEDPTVCFNQTEIRGRARELTVKPEPEPGRAGAVLENKNFQNPEKKKIEIRPPRNRSGAPKKLSRFQNSVIWWLFQNHSLESYREGVILSARFLECACDDEYCRQLERNWKDCGDASRPGLVTDLIKYLRTIEPAHGPETARPPLRIAGPAPSPSAPGSLSEILGGGMGSGILYPPPDKNCPPQNTENKTENETDSGHRELMGALMFGEKYRGPYTHIVEMWSMADGPGRDWIIDNIDSLKKRTKYNLI